MKSQPRGPFETAAGVLVVVLGIASLAIIADSGSLAWFLVLAPVVTCFIALATGRRELIWFAFGSCLGIGILALLGAGLFPFLTGFALLSWWIISRRRLGERVFEWVDVPWELSGLTAMVFVILVG